MDKKKVIELIEQILDTLSWRVVVATENAYEAKLKCLEQLEEVKYELSKSDWIPVESELPPYDEEVLVTNKDKSVWFTFRAKEKRPIRDRNGFSCPGYFGITHWCKIEKLNIWNVK